MFSSLERLLFRIGDILSSLESGREQGSMSHQKAGSDYLTTSLLGTHPDSIIVVPAIDAPEDPDPGNE